MSMTLVLASPGLDPALLIWPPQQRGLTSALFRLSVSENYFRYLDAVTQVTVLNSHKPTCYVLLVSCCDVGFFLGFFCVVFFFWAAGKEGKVYFTGLYFRLDKVGSCCLCQKRIPPVRIPCIIWSSLFLCRTVVLQQHALALGGSVPGAALHLQDPQMLQG